MSLFNRVALDLVRAAFAGEAAYFSPLAQIGKQVQFALRKQDEYASVNVVMDDRPGEDDRVFVTCDRAPSSVQKFVTVYGAHADPEKLPSKIERFEGLDDAIVVEFKCTIEKDGGRPLVFVGSKVLGVETKAAEA